MPKCFHRIFFPSTKSKNDGLFTLTVNDVKIACPGPERTRESLAVASIHGTVRHRNLSVKPTYLYNQVVDSSD